MTIIPAAGMMWQEAQKFDPAYKTPNKEKQEKSKQTLVLMQCTSFTFEYKTV